MGKKLTNTDYCRAAKKIKGDVASIKAVDYTESRGSGFYSDGFPVILFERHIFRKYTNGRFTSTHPELSGPAGNYGAAGQHQRDKFNAAYELDPVAAMKACSWGKYQIMGFNYDSCGFSSVGEFVDAMKESEGRQLDAFVSFVIHNKLDKYLRTHNWAAFAKGYNGADYKKNAYDTKLASAYARFAKEKINCDGIQEDENPELVKKTVDSEPVNNPVDVDDKTGSANEPIDNYPEEPKPGEPTPDASAKPGEPIVGGRPGDEPKEVPAVTATTVSGWRTWPTTIVATLGSLGLSVGGVLTSVSGISLSPEAQVIVGWIIIVGIIAAAFYGLFYLISRAIATNRKEQRAHELTLEQMRLAADPAKYNVIVTGQEKK